MIFVSKNEGKTHCLNHGFDGLKDYADLVELKHKDITEKIVGAAFVVEGKVLVE